MIFIYIIEQEIQRGKLAIKDIHTSTLVSKRNMLERFFRYNQEFENENLRYRLTDLIDKIDVIFEKDYLKTKIFEYLENNEQQVLLGSDLKEQMLQDQDIVPAEKKTHFVKKVSENKVKSTKSIQITCNGKVYNSVYEFTKTYGMNHSTVWTALKRGDTPEEILERHLGGKKKPIKSSIYIYMGEEMTVKELSELSGVPTTTLYQRLNTLKWPVEKAVETPVTPSSNS